MNCSSENGFQRRRNARKPLLTVTVHSLNETTWHRRIRDPYTWMKNAHSQDFLLQANSKCIFDELLRWNSFFMHSNDVVSNEWIVKVVCSGKKLRNHKIWIARIQYFEWSLGLVNKSDAPLIVDYKQSQWQKKLKATFVSSQFSKFFFCTFGRI